MTGNLLRNHWMEICGDCRAYWGKLTDDDLQQINGQFDRFVATLRARYGFSQIKAEEELEQFLFRYSDSPRSAGAALSVAG
jgi:uncharacterized protein YjbJ (UPF0337 family)